MPNPLVSYNPTANVATLGGTFDPQQAVEWLAGGVYPEELIKLSANTNNWRDATIYYALQKQDSPDGISNVLNTLAFKLQTIPQIDRNNQAICEILAAISISIGEHKLAKETLMRVPPTFSSRLTQLLAKRLSHQVLADDYKGFAEMIKSSGKVAAVKWADERSRLGL